MKDPFLELYPEGYIIGGLTNGMIVKPDQTIIFLPYDPMRQFQSRDKITKEIKNLSEGND